MLYIARETPRTVFVSVVGLEFEPNSRRYCRWRVGSILPSHERPQTGRNRYVCAVNETDLTSYAISKISVESGSYLRRRLHPLKGLAQARPRRAPYLPRALPRSHGPKHTQILTDKPFEDLILHDLGNPTLSTSGQAPRQQT